MYILLLLGGISYKCLCIRLIDSAVHLFTALLPVLLMGFSGGTVVKNLPANAGDCLIPGLGRPPGVRNGNPFQYSCLEKAMGREA